VPALPEPQRDISDPLSGQRWIFLRTGADTGGELFEAELHVSAGGFVREHAHPAQEETFHDLAGRRPGSWKMPSCSRIFALS
jgi:quercetin dioxygenase-like cupin family protein